MDSLLSSPGSLSYFPGDEKQMKGSQRRITEAEVCSTLLTLPTVLEAGSEKHMEASKETLQATADRTWKEVSI